MKRKTLFIGLIVFLFVPLISVMPTIKADEMFFVDFYAVDSQGTPLNGVEIEVTGIYGYDEFVYSGRNGFAPRLALISDQRNAHYNWTATYQLDSESGDFYVPINYNAVNIVMSDVNVPTPTPNPTPSATPTIAPSPTLAPTSNPTSNPAASPTATPTPTTAPSPTLAPTSNPTSNPAASPTATPTPTTAPSPTLAPTSNPTSNPAASPTATPTKNTQTTAPTATPTIPEFPSIAVSISLISSTILTLLIYFKKHKE